MKINKTYYSISEVSRMLNIREHTIRYWDSKLPGLSKHSDKGKTRFFTKTHISKISSINSLLKNFSSMDLAYKIITKDKSPNVYTRYNDQNNSNSASYNFHEKINKIQKITKNLKSLIEEK